MGKGDVTDLWKKGLAEVARVVAAMVTILAFLWMFFEPAAEIFVEKVIDGKGLASKATVDELTDRLKEMSGDQDTLGKDVAGIKSQLDSIEQLAREQRAMQAQILLKIGSP